jgi:RecB family exonuclease
VDGPLAFRTRRLAAARANEIGTEVLTLPLLAARLAGGFCRLADRDLLAPAISAALGEGGFTDIETVRSLPGMVRAAMETLAQAWTSDLDLVALKDGAPRLADLALIHERVRKALPRGVLLPQDLRDAALARVAFAKKFFGSITLERVVDVDPVWRPLLVALAGVMELSWRGAGVADRRWFARDLTVVDETPPHAIEGDLCADPRAEVVEALRWTRELLSEGGVAAADVAIVAASPSAWDDHMLVLAGESALPIHFSHGRPALATWEGQGCAALADVLINGLSQDRVRRLLRHANSPAAQALPADWAAGIPQSAGLFTLNEWRQAFVAARDNRKNADLAETVLLPILEQLSRGTPRARDVGELLLTGPSLGLWEEALRDAPAAAIALSLQTLRIRDARDPGNSIVWGPASHLVGAPRRFMRMVGLDGRAWPRPESEDPLLPNHIVPRRQLVPVSITERDRVAFRILRDSTAERIVLSRSQRSARGTLQGASALWPAATAPQVRLRNRIAEHAFSEADRLLARPAEAGQLAQVRATRACWRNWARPEMTPHDGAVRPNHPAIDRAITRLHSATSLTRLARDPLGFVWRYALDMRPLSLASRPLALDTLMFGELVHELLRRTVDALEPEPGFVSASRDEIEIALAAARDHIRARWPIERPVPPSLLWSHTLDEAMRRGLPGLTRDQPFQAGTRSWTELDFGGTDTGHASAPWPASREAVIGSAGLRLGGRIDRVDLSKDGDRIRISDYKTGQPQPGANIVLAGGRELQRVIYAIAVRQLLPELTVVISRLVFLGQDATSMELKGEDLDAACHEIGHYLDLACAQLRRGHACPGPDARDRYNDLRLALPADLDGYFQRKSTAFRDASRELSVLWGRP